MIDFLKIYDLERYLFDEVGPRFRSKKEIDPTDFFMIFIWKSNRAKTKTRDRLKKVAKGDFSDAVKEISKALSSAETAKDRLAILVDVWGLRLPMASAILTVLYPDEFTVYDIRVCRVLNLTYRDYLTYSENCWVEYERYKREVYNNTPSTLSLRDRDRYLWGKSFYHDAAMDAQ